MRDASQRQFDVVIFWALDRFTREGALQTLQYLNQLSSYSVGYRSSTEPYLDSCGMFKDAVIAILGTIAKQERVRLSERVRAGLHRARSHEPRAGKPLAGPGQCSGGMRSRNYGPSASPGVKLPPKRA
jgi:DNA invertase Pin-like site-specific DNA recombinase